MPNASDYRITDGKTPPGRTCGDCSACCTVLAISTLDKPAGVHCQHLKHAAGGSTCASAGQCSIYASRPRPCAGFVCVWLRDTIGLLGEEDRPDRSGLLFTASNPDAKGQQNLKVYEVYQGATKTVSALETLSRLRPLIPIQIVPFAPAKKSA